MIKKLDTQEKPLTNTEWIIYTKLNEIIDHLEQKTERPEYKENNNFMADMYSVGERQEVIKEVISILEYIFNEGVNKNSLKIPLMSVRAISKLKTLIN